MPSLSDPADPSPSALQIGLGRLHAGQDRVPVAEQHLAGLGQPDLAGAGRALDQAPPDQPLERPDLLADGGLDVAQPGGCPPERALLGDRLECGQVPDLDPGGMIDLHVLQNFSVRLRRSARRASRGRRMNRAPAAAHRLAVQQRVDDRLLGRLDRGVEERIDLVVRDEVDGPALGRSGCRSRRRARSRRSSSRPRRPCARSRAPSAAPAGRTGAGAAARRSRRRR